MKLRGFCDMVYINKIYKLEEAFNMPRKSVRVTKETPKGRNVGFKDKATKTTMTKQQFVRKIESGAFPGYHIRVINGIKTPVSNPDGSTSNNLG